MERIVRAAVRVNDDVFTALRHAQCYEHIAALHLPRPQLASEAEGFMTSEFRFVSRAEAAIIAKQANQLPADSPITILYSEDIWPEEN